jgi:hypothetical protein
MLRVGNGTSVLSQNCQMTLRIRYPIGCTSAVFEVRNHGYANIGGYEPVDKDVTGSASVQYSLSGGSANPTSPDGIIISVATIGGRDGQWSMQHDVATTRNVASGQQDATFTIRLTVSINQPRYPAKLGIIQAESVLLSILDQAAC